MIGMLRPLILAPGLIFDGRDEGVYCIQKPFAIQTLAAKVREALGS